MSVSLPAMVSAARVVRELTQKHKKIRWIMVQQWLLRTMVVRGGEEREKEREERELDHPVMKMVC